MADPRPTTGAVTEDVERGSSLFVHDAFVYGSDEEFVDGLLPFIQEGIEIGEPVTAVTTEHNIGLLRDALGPAASEVLFTDHRDFYETPARTIARNNEVRDAFFAAGARRMRVVGEVRFPAEAASQREWLRYEALVNQVLSTSPQWSICPYDRRTLPCWVVHNAERTHAHVHQHGERVRSERYGEPAAVARELSPPPPRVTSVPAFELLVAADEISRAREELADMVLAAGVGRDRAVELAMGLNEIVTNALQHGSDRALVRCWKDDNRVLCEVVDHGPGLDDPFAGYCPPSPERLDGRGLWLARQIFDRVELLPGNERGLCATMAAELDGCR